MGEDVCICMYVGFSSRLTEGRHRWLWCGSRPSPPAHWRGCRHRRGCSSQSCSRRTPGAATEYSPTYIHTYITLYHASCTWNSNTCMNIIHTYIHILHYIHASCTWNSNTCMNIIHTYIHTYIHILLVFFQTYVHTYIHTYMTPIATYLYIVHTFI